MSQITLPLSVEWWTPETLAAEIGVSVGTVRDRFKQLSARNVLTRHQSTIYMTSSEAQTLANYIMVAARKSTREKISCRETVS